MLMVAVGVVEAAVEGAVPGLHMVRVFSSCNEEGLVPP